MIAGKTKIERKLKRIKQFFRKNVPSLRDKHYCGSMKIFHSYYETQNQARRDYFLNEYVYMCIIIVHCYQSFSQNDYSFFVIKQESPMFLCYLL